MLQGLRDQALGGSIGAGLGQDLHRLRGRHPQYPLEVRDPAQSPGLIVHIDQEVAGQQDLQRVEPSLFQDQPVDQRAEA